MARPALLLVSLMALLAFAPSAQAATEVKIMNGFFSPDTLVVAPGEEVVFTNLDDIAHTVTSSWDNGETFSHVVRPGESATVVFTEEGSYQIHCIPHPDMVATIQVQAAGSTPAGEGDSTLLVLAGIVAAVLAITAVAFVAMRRRLPQTQP